MQLLGLRAPQPDHRTIKTMRSTPAVGPAPTPTSSCLLSRAEPTPAAEPLSDADLAWGEAEDAIEREFDEFGDRADEAYDLECAGFYDEEEDDQW